MLWRNICLTGEPDAYIQICGQCENMFILNSLVTVFEYCAPEVIFSWLIGKEVCVCVSVCSERDRRVAIPLNACHTQVCQCNHVSHLTYVSQTFCLRRDAEL